MRLIITSIFLVFFLSAYGQNIRPKQIKPASDADDKATVLMSDPSTGVFDYANDGIILPYDAASTYSVNDIVTFGGYIYRSTANSNVTTPSVGDWELLTVTGAGSGDVVGPVSATDNAAARFDNTTGKLIQNSAVTIDDSGNIATAGTVDGRDVSVDGALLDEHSDTLIVHDNRLVLLEQNKVVVEDTLTAHNTRLVALESGGGANIGNSDLTTTGVRVLTTGTNALTIDGTGDISIGDEAANNNGQYIKISDTNNEIEMFSPGVVNIGDLSGDAYLIVEVLDGLVDIWGASSATIQSAGLSRIIGDQANLQGSTSSSITAPIVNINTLNLQLDTLSVDTAQYLLARQFDGSVVRVDKNDITGSSLTASQIRDSLATLTGTDRLSTLSIKGDTISILSNDTLYYRVDGVDVGFSVLPAGGGGVTSVNGFSGVVVLDADDIGTTGTTNKFITSGDLLKLSIIENGATADQTAAQVPHTDAGGYYTTDNSEAIAQQIGSEQGIQDDTLSAHNTRLLAIEGATSQLDTLYTKEGVALTNGDTIPNAIELGSNPSVNGIAIYEGADALILTSPDLLDFYAPSITFHDPVNVPASSILSSAVNRLQLDSLVTALQTFTDSTTLTVDLAGKHNKIIEWDMTGVSNAGTITLAEPLNAFGSTTEAGVYTFVIFDCDTHDFDFPASFRNMGGSTAYDAGTTVEVVDYLSFTCYFNGTIYRCQ